MTKMNITKISSNIFSVCNSTFFIAFKDIMGFLAAYSKHVFVLNFLVENQINRRK